MQLSKAQAKFKDTMLAPPSRLDDLPKDVEDLFEHGGIDIGTRLKVYRNNIVGSLTDVMIASFPVIDTLVGREFFEGMARSFILENPPAHGSLTFYGSDFDKFISTFEPAKSLPYLADMAALEIAMNDSYYAADDTALDVNTLATLSPEELLSSRLELRSSAKLITSDYPLSAVRDYCLAEASEEQTDETLTPPDLGAGSEYILALRPRFAVDLVILTAEEYHMLDILRAGAPIEQALSSTLEAYPEFSFDNFLSRHFALETFCALTPNTEQNNGVL